MNYGISTEGRTDGQGGRRTNDIFEDAEPVGHRPKYHRETLCGQQDEQDMEAEQYGI